MGGCGSGRHARRRTVEEPLGLPVSWMYHRGAIRPGWAGTVFWTSPEPRAHRLASIGVVVRSVRELIVIDRVTVQAHSSETLHYPVRVSWTCCHFGGERPWWICPGRECGRRVACLYLARSYLLCRHCYGLTYASRQASGTIQRPRQKIMKLRRRLGAPVAPPFGFELSDWGVERPRYMHWTTY